MGQTQHHKYANTAIPKKLGHAHSKDTKSYYYSYTFDAYNVRKICDVNKYLKILLTNAKYERRNPTNAIYNVRLLEMFQNIFGVVGCIPKKVKP